MKESVTTLPGSLNVSPYQWTTAHHNVPPEWLDQEGRPCVIGDKHGTMQIVNGRLICIVNSSPKESTKMNDVADVVTEATTLRFSSPSRVQISKAQVYWDIHRRQKGLGVVKVGPIEGTDGNWYFDVSSHNDNQFLTTSRMNNILPGGVTVTSGGPVVTQQNASQNNSDAARNAIREMVNKVLGEGTSDGQRK